VYVEPNVGRKLANAGVLDVLCDPILPHLASFSRS
jgi:hypothetical protein